MYNSKYISTATTTNFAIKGSGTLHSVIIGETAAGSITISDTRGTIAVLKASIAEGFYILDVNYVGSLTVITAGASKVTVTYN